MSGYRKLARGARRLAWLNCLCAVLFLVTAVLNALDSEWVIAAIWCAGAGIWVWCAAMNFDIGRSYDKTADIYDETASIYRELGRSL